MSDAYLLETLALSPEPLELEQDQALRSRALLVQRLCDLVCWPSSLIPRHERDLAGDVLVGLLRTSTVEIRIRCAERLAAVADAPKVLLRFLARDDIAVAAPLLENSPALDESDLVATIFATGRNHWQVIARRKRLPEIVSEALVRQDDPQVNRFLLGNAAAPLSFAAVQSLVAQSRGSEAVADALAARPELNPAQGLTLFWWARAETRLTLLRRFATDRAVLCQELAELFKVAAEENWADPETRRALALIERRQRSRAAAERSPHGSLQGAVEYGYRHGIDTELAAEIAHLSGVRPVTGAQIFSDAGGEGVGVLCKATGLKRDSLRMLWLGLGRSDENAENDHSPFGRVLYVFETLSTSKAQTVLRYWNWALTSGGQPSLAALSDPQDEALEFLPAQRIAALVFGAGAFKN